MQEVELGGDKSFVGGWLLSDLKICDELSSISTPRRARSKARSDTTASSTRTSGLARPLHSARHFSHRSSPNICACCARSPAPMREISGRHRGAALGHPENINIQYYKPAGGYKEWHTERIGRMLPSAVRHLAFMTYLNDVNDEGGTEFYYQRLKCQPRKGLTLIWPATGRISTAASSRHGEKYIITGWFSFL